MGEIILFLVFLIPAMLGLAEIIHIFKTCLFYPKNIDSYMLVYLSNENSAAKLNFVLEQYYWFGKKYFGNIIAIASDLNKENYDVCQNIAEKHGIIFCNENELDEVLAEINKK